ncbi:CCA tRNA nucleotidyltransferase [Palleronia caenipelagi]|uniref:CCA tRNA nucleotidyltransferase n=2 Tax=Palleronia caenipelagi TaxID=2489174 RepID=A0A547Q2P6_9RHOB|nr:CCA tRNA nucleotidyltransferase [Palleronia caenipelagi]TRD20649.1 CCA tRNA nucleotidyltransferase [Palleronia caenipelagi]
MLQRFMAAMSAKGYQILFVGGCVRNAALGAPVADLDLATDAKPEEVTRIAEDLSLKVIPTGIAHGTVTVIADGQPLEVTTFRRDVETDGRRAVVAFATDIAEDAMRRDFTMNALYAEADGTVRDPLGGLPDLHARCVRFVGDADQRIAEDYLRILRFFRFHAWYGAPEEGLDADAVAACAAGAEGLAHVSAERIGHEMRRLLAAPDPAPATASMAQTGVLMRVLPGAETAPLAPLVHLEDLTGTAPDWRRRLVALGGEGVAERLRLSRAEARHLATLRAALGSEAGLAELGWRHGADIARDVALIRAASFGVLPPHDMDTQIALGAEATFPVRAADLPSETTGAEIGQMLRRLQQDWIASNFSLGRAELLASL